MMDVDRIEGLVSAGESLEREFKSDRGRLSDKDIFEEVVSMANTDGGILFIGVEDDGRITGASPRHGNTTDPFKLQSAIFNNTVPNINSRVSVVPHPNGTVITIAVDPYPEPCATASGKSLRRTIGPDGKPQTVPFYPRDQRSRRIELGLMDFSAQPIAASSFNDFDPLEFERVRQAISRLKGEPALLELSHEELAKALRLVESREGRLIPNVAGLLLLGKQERLRELVPTHQVFFQVLDAQGSVKVNDVFSGPVVRVLNELESRFSARNEEREFLVGFIRVPVPDYSPEGYREAVNNALLHRDYSLLDSVYVQWQPDHLLITNPGGFLPGITVENILVHEPKPRSPRLADAFRRIGLVEQTGRGVDKIYRGQVRYGRPLPDYTRSDSTGVRVVLRGGKPSLEFSAFVYEQEESGSPLSLDELIVLNTLFFERRMESVLAAKIIQKGANEGRAVLERLVERGFVEAKGEKKGRIYHLSAQLYRRFGDSSGYVRVHGISALKQEAMVMEFVEAHGRIARKDVMDLCGISGDQSGRLLKRLEQKGLLDRKGSPPRWTYYVQHQ
ncbi:MAG: RNA-binding domain-containing protein [Desulfomonilaceae bacterium]